LPRWGMTPTASRSAQVLRTCLDLTGGWTRVQFPLLEVAGIAPMGHASNRFAVRPGPAHLLGPFRAAGSIPASGGGGNCPDGGMAPYRFAVRPGPAHLLGPFRAAGRGFNSRFWRWRELPRWGILPTASRSASVLRTCLDLSGGWTRVQFSFSGGGGNCPDGA
jgi:hypothetical protein